MGVIRQESLPHFHHKLPAITVGDPRTYTDTNAVSGPVVLNGEVGAIIDTTHSKDGEYKHDIVIKKKGTGRGDLQRIDSAHYMKEPLMYPLLFPFGTPGFGNNKYFHQRYSTRKNGERNTKKESHRTNILNIECTVVGVKTTTCTSDTAS